MQERISTLLKRYFLTVGALAQLIKKLSKMICCRVAFTAENNCDITNF